MKFNQRRAYKELMDSIRMAQKKREAMSIILEGIDLPTDRKPYGIEVIYRFEGADGLFSEKNYLSPNQAIQIPKDHGRLIDSEEILTPIYCIPKTIGLTDKAQMHLTDMIENAPTILEAEE